MATATTTSRQQAYRQVTCIHSSPHTCFALPTSILSMQRQRWVPPLPLPTQVRWRHTMQCADEPSLVCLQYHPSLGTTSGSSADWSLPWKATAGMTMYAVPTMTPTEQSTTSFHRSAMPFGDWVLSIRHTTRQTLG